MIKFQKITKLLVLTLGIGILFSCGNDDDVIEFACIGDVYVSKRMIGDDIKYANSYFAYGNQRMNLAQVTTFEGAEINLTATDEGGYTYGKEAELSDFSIDFPVEGNYTFDVLHDDVPHQSIDLLTFEDLDFTTVSALISEFNRLTVEWEANASAEMYMIRLVNENNEVVFGSSSLPNNITRFEIDAITGSGAWTSGYPNVGDEYTLELHTFTFDDDATDIDFSFNIQEISITEEAVIWE